MNFIKNIPLGNYKMKNEKNLPLRRKRNTADFYKFARMSPCFIRVSSKLNIIYNV